MPTHTHTHVHVHVHHLHVHDAILPLIKGAAPLCTCMYMYLCKCIDMYTVHVFVRMCGFNTCTAVMIVSKILLFLFLTCSFPSIHFSFSPPLYNFLSPPPPPSPLSPSLCFIKADHLSLEELQSTGMPGLSPPQDDHA